MKNCVSSLHSGLRIIMGCNIWKPEEGRFNVWNQNCTDSDTGKFALFHSFLPHVLVIPQPDYTRRDASVIGITRTLSRIDCIFINLPMAEVRAFYCYSHVIENLVNWSIPSDDAAVCIVMYKLTDWGQWGKRNLSWMSKHCVFCSVLKRFDDNHRFTT